MASNDEIYCTSTKLLFRRIDNNVLNKLLKSQEIMKYKYSSIKLLIGQTSTTNVTNQSIKI